MKLKFINAIVITILLVLSSSIFVVVADEPSGSQLEIVESNGHELIVVLTASDFEVEHLVEGGQTYHRLLIPEMVQTDVAGAPQVPTRGALLGIPNLEGVSIQILETSHQTLQGYTLYPAPVLETVGGGLDGALAGDNRPVFAPDQTIYQTDAFYPNTPAVLGDTGYMRDQAFAQVQFYPVQYNPITDQLRFYTKIVLRLTWDQPAATRQTESQASSPAYETLLERSLLNYQMLNRPAPLVRTLADKDLTITPTTFDTATVKLGVTEDGLYQITPADLTNVGFDLTGLPLSTLKVKNQGNEVAIWTHDDNGNDEFDGNDYLLFYGTGINNIFTTKNIYWLEGGGNPGERMQVRFSTTGGGTVPIDFPTTYHAEEDTIYWLIPGGDAAEDHWFWGLPLSPGTQGIEQSRTYTVTLNNVSTSATTLTIQARYRGRTSLGHRTKISLNGTEISDESWTGEIVYDQIAIADHNLLQEGDNVILVEAADSGDALPHQFLVNSFDIRYWDTYVAENDSLIFTAPNTGSYQFEVTGFSSDDIQLFDITDMNNPVVVTDTTITADGAGFKLQFEDTPLAETHYLALTAAQHKTPASLVVDEPSNLKMTTNQADYIIITYKDFYSETLELSEYRTQQGLAVMTVKIEDVYDEFNGGVYHPQAIRDFLDYAYYNWTSPAPTYVLLVSGATYDHRNLFDLGRANHIPTHFITTETLGETTSDNWFVTVSGDDIVPDMLIGRLPVQTAQDVTDMITKIKNYEQNPPGSPWNTIATFVADDGNPGDPDEAFETNSDYLASRLPHYYGANKVYLLSDPPTDPTVATKTFIDDGTLLLNYAGHGNRSQWGNEGILTPDKISTLSNTDKLPVVTVANCLNGYFIGSSASMGEAFMYTANQGGVAVWADSSLNYPSGHRLLVSGFYDAIFQEDIYDVGAAATASKIEAYAQSTLWAELVETFVLLGDPATQFGLPTNYPYVINATPPDKAIGVAPEQDIVITFSKPVVAGTVSLNSNQGSMVFTPILLSGTTVISYPHPPFPDGTYTVTVSAQDKLGNDLGAGLVPNIWLFTVGGGYQVYLPVIIK